MSDAHSCCKNSKTRAELGIKGNDYGIRRGWFFWPSNFDPVWLENRDGFSKKGRK